MPRLPRYVNIKSKLIVLVTCSHAHVIVKLLDLHHDDGSLQSERSVSRCYCTISACIFFGQRNFLAERQFQDLQTCLPTNLEEHCLWQQQAESFGWYQRFIAHLYFSKVGFDTSEAEILFPETGKYFQNFLQFGQADLIDSSTRLSDLNLGSSAAASSSNKPFSVFFKYYNTLQIKNSGLFTQVRQLLTIALNFSNWIKS